MGNQNTTKCGVEVRDELTAEGTRRNIFLISTPFQFIVASMISKQVRGYSRLIVVTDFAESLRQIERASQLLGIQSYETVGTPCDYRSRIVRLWREACVYRAMLRIRSELKSDDRVFIGLTDHPANRPILFGGKRKRFNIAFFDDGTASIVFLKSREAGERTKHFPRASPLRFYSWFYPRRLQLQNLTYYTIYSQLKGAIGDVVVDIRPRLPQALNRNKKSVNEIWFVGGPLIGANLIAENRMVELVKGICGVAKEMDLKLIYFPHRTESSLSCFKDLDLRTPGLPFELFFGQSEKQPVAMVSIISSAVINAKVFFGDGCPVALIDPEREYDKKCIGTLQCYSRDVLHIPVVSSGEFKAFVQGVLDHRSACE